jgi:hypothetical protein
MNARTADFPAVSFQPWLLGSHLFAVGACLLITADGLSLNYRDFGRYILKASQIPEALYPVYAPLALWWANGGNVKPLLIAADTYQLGNTRANLRPWRCAERLAALAHCQQDSEQGLNFDLAAYLMAMVKTCVVSIEKDKKLEELDSASCSALLSAIIALNIRSANPSTDYLLSSKQASSDTLRICRALGWTPSQVMAAPAVEIDLILALLNRVETNNSVQNSRATSRLADHPDAVVIQIEDD